MRGRAGDGRAAASPSSEQVGATNGPTAIDAQVPTRSASPLASGSGQADLAFLPSSVVHELRTPLTAIHGYAQLLRRGGNLTGVSERAVDTILRETTRLAAQLKQLSEVVELRSGRFTASAESADVGQLAREAVELVRHRPDAPDLVVQGEASIQARCDAQRLMQVLAHVLSNAVSYTPPAGKVQISVEGGADGARVSIEDNGIGIDEEERERVYEPYYRGARAQRSGVRGLGLGLYVAREVARRCGGDLTHEPTAGGGTKFHLTWPSA